jgi:hypothetical protein
MITVVNMIPNSWSDEQNQDTEPNISVNPANPAEMIATAFTYDNPAGTSAVSPAMTGNWAPIYYSVDGGTTWMLEFVLSSGAGAILPTYDVTVRYGGNSGVVYSGLISSVSGSILISRAPNATTQQQLLVTRSGDQPFVEATTALGGSGAGEDRVYVGYNGAGATIDQSQNAATPPAPAGFTQVLVDARSGSDGPKIRTAIHADGTIYGAFYSANSDGTWDAVVVKDLNWGTSVPPYTALIDSGDGKAGIRVAASISVSPSGTEDTDFGCDRRGWELAIAVDPNNDQRVYICYSEGTSAANYTLHLRESVDGGKTWLPDARTILVAKNPGVAISMLGDVGFLYQQVVGPTGSSSWQTIFEHTSNDFSTFDSHTLSNVPTCFPTPASVMATYIGDYVKLQAIGNDFFGVFSANNTPNLANFPSGVNYQRNVNMATATLLGNDGVTTVPVSIDPFFFSYTTVDPSADFYVRDWTASPVSFDTGVEPSTNPVFYTTSDVWNQQSNVAPTFNALNQPNSQDAQVASLGPNYAFARIWRRAPASSTAASAVVTAEFLFADFGLGVPFADVSSTPTTTVTFLAADNELLTTGVSWLLPATHSQHVCLAVQISAPGDPYQLPSLLGLSPGWPYGSDSTVLNDNHKAQRNLGVYPAGESGQESRYWAILHNAALETRDMLVEYTGGLVRGEATGQVTVSIYGEAPTTLKAGEILRLPGMLPGENRWLAINIAGGGKSSALTVHDFAEVFGGKTLSGFRVVAQPTTTAALVRANIAGEHALLARSRALFGTEPPNTITRILERLGIHRDEPDPVGYREFVAEFVLKGNHLELLEAEVDLMPIDVEEHQRRLSGAIRRQDTGALAAAHARLLHELDALLTMAQKARGDVGDILLNVNWQRALYSRAPVSLNLIDAIRQESTKFIQAFQERKAVASDFALFIHRLVPDLERTILELGAAGVRLEPLVRRLAEKVGDPSTVQKDHRAFLIALQSLL